MTLGCSWRVTVLRLRKRMDSTLVAFGHPAPSGGTTHSRFVNNVEAMDPCAPEMTNDEGKTNAQQPKGVPGSDTFDFGLLTFP